MPDSTRAAYRRLDGDRSLFRPLQPVRIRGSGGNDGQKPEEGFRRTLEESDLLLRIRNREPDIRRYRESGAVSSGALRYGTRNAGSIDTDGNMLREDTGRPVSPGRKEQITLIQAYELQRHSALFDLPGERLDISA